jgi:hypothetical protein
MPGEPPDGTCSLCGDTYPKQGMTNHLAACREKHVTSDHETFQLMVEGRYRPDFWLHLDINTEATLADLDSFLREMWLEPCCGHMSAFTIDETRYSVQPMADLNERNMDVSLQQVFDGGTEFTHEYDFGTTTELVGRVSATELGAPEDESSGHGPDAIQLLAQNELPDIRCGVCGSPATVVCSIHNHEQEGWLCDDCAPDHECNEEMFLPVVNSPRVGMCAYSGPDQHVKIGHEERSAVSEGYIVAVKQSVFQETPLTEDDFSDDRQLVFASKEEAEDWTSEQNRRHAKGGRLTLHTAHPNDTSDAAAYLVFQPARGEWVPTS